VTGNSFALDADPGAMPTSAVTEADLERLAAQRTAATWTLACWARDATDFAELCEALDLDTSRASLTAVRDEFGPKAQARRRCRRTRGTL
jgi:hypothetical protein